MDACIGNTYYFRAPYLHTSPPLLRWLLIICFCFLLTRRRYEGPHSDSAHGALQHGRHSHQLSGRGAHVEERQPRQHCARSHGRWRGW